MSNFQKLYSYYFTNLFRKNWIKITLLVTITTLFTWFIFGFIGFKAVQKGEEFLFGEKANKENYRDYNEFALKSEVVQFAAETYLEAKKRTWEELAQAHKSGDQDKINQAKKNLKILGEGWISSILRVFKVFVPPAGNFEVNFFFLDVESKSKGVELWKSINSLSYWALGSGLIFSWLTLSLIDFLFLDPKKNGEDALVLSFTPGIKREDLLFSKILAFLTYFFLFALVTFVFPCLAYYLWVGSLAPLGKFALLFAYMLIVAPLLIFGLLLLPYLLVSDWSSTLGSILPWVIFLVPGLWSGISGHLLSPTLHSLENLFFHPLVFASLALTVGISCFTFYYWKYSTQDLKN
ncbi:MAG: hypothetical protein I3273_00355 [Candidatus Moeniiplasma glomeromycotorum]|nr:hypothetical protein [Candidatus Moeniiplasma glomeromycotorum]MCE8167419.1 hypothetical protein [Candidatus Moeniiplasma glomeromycotorum]MCE8168567.1 hypothetical protein [Candidatus Moeniiplasma glomeromycotorum]